MDRHGDEAVPFAEQLPLHDVVARLHDARRRRAEVLPHRDDELGRTRHRLDRLAAREFLVVVGVNATLEPKRASNGFHNTLSPCAKFTSFHRLLCANF